MGHRLRLYTGGEEESTTIAEPKTSVRLGDVVRILADAALWNRTWLRDFEDEDVEISSDLYEVLSTYWHLRPSA